MQKVSRSGLPFPSEKQTPFQELGFPREWPPLFLSGGEPVPWRGCEGEGGWDARRVQGCKPFPQPPHTGAAGAAWVTPHGKTWGMQTPGVHGYRRGRAARHCCLGLARVPAAFLSFPGSPCTEMVGLLMVPIPPTPGSSGSSSSPCSSSGCPPGAKQERGLAPSPAATPLSLACGFLGRRRRCFAAAKQKGGGLCRLHQGHI